MYQASGTLENNNKRKSVKVERKHTGLQPLPESVQPKYMATKYSDYTIVEKISRNPV